MREARPVSAAHESAGLSLGQLDGDWDDACLLLLADLDAGDYSAARSDVLVQQRLTAQRRQEISDLRRAGRRRARRAKLFGRLGRGLGIGFGAIGTVVALYYPPAGAAIKAAGKALSGGLDLGRLLERGRQERILGRSRMAQVEKDEQQERCEASLELLEDVAQLERRFCEQIRACCLQAQETRSMTERGAARA